MKVLVIGLGSMGKRRIRLIKEIDASIQIVGVDLNNSRCSEVQNEYSIITYNDLIECIEKEDPNAAFVCTSPLSHHSIIDKLLGYNVYVFTELNLVSDGYDRYVKEDKLFLSSTFLYRQDIRWMIDKVNKSRVNYIYHSGQYLPDWHPWEDYRTYFVSDKKSNGCREIMAIEFPWIIEAFGDINSYNVYKDKLSNLDIDYPDNYVLQLKHKNGSVGLITIDIVSRFATRKLEIFNENIQILWEGRPDSLLSYNIEKKEFENITVYDSIQHKEGYSNNIIENAYKAEVEAFFKYMSGVSSEALYDFKKDQKILGLIDKIEE